MRLSLLITGLLWGVRVFAQDADIVVTATKEPAPADTLPVTVIVLGADELKDKTTVSEALQNTLAVRLQSLTPGEPALTAPGFGENGFDRMSLLVDGVSQNNPDMAAPPLNLVPVFALERIEIVRGPLSALYGNAAGGGAVNLVTKTPRTFEIQTTLDVALGGTNRQLVAVGVPVGEGGLLLSVARDQELPVRDRSDSDRYQAWGKFSAPFGSQAFEVWAAFTRADTQLPGALSVADFDDDPDQAVNAGDRVERTENTGAASWSVSGEGWKLTIPVSGLLRSTRNTTQSFSAYNDAALLRGSAEPQLSVSGSWLAADAEWSTGLGASADHLGVTRYTDATFMTKSMTAGIDRWTASLWSRGQLGWAQTWFLSADARVEVSRTQAHSDQSPNVDGRRDFFPLAGDVGLTWLPSREFKAAVELSRVYRYPFIEEMISYYGFPSDDFLTDVDAEVGHGGTLSGQWTSGPWKVIASGTLLKMENEVAFDEVAFVNRNQGPVWHGSSLVSGSWTMDLAGTSTVSLGAEYDFERAVFADGDNQGKLVPLIPAHRGRLSAQVDDRAWSVEAGWVVSSSFYPGGDNANTVKQISGRQSLDVSATILLGSAEWALRVYGRNLTDDRTPDAAFWNQFSGTSVYPSEGRVLGASVTWTH